MTEADAVPPPLNGTGDHPAPAASTPTPLTTSPPSDAPASSPTKPTIPFHPDRLPPRPSSPPPAGSPTSSESHPPPSSSADGEEPSAKRQRKRKSLWDQPSPAALSGAFVPPPSTPSLPIHPQFAQLQSQLALLPHLSPSPYPAPLSAAHALSSPTTASRLDRRIYVGSLAYDIPEDVIRQIFEPFGVVAKVDMPKEPGHYPVRSKGFCFVEFDRVDSAKAALMTMNGVPLRGRPMKVGKPTGGAGSEYGSFLSQLMQGGGGGLGALAGQQLNTTALAAIQAAQIASGGTFNPAAFTMPQQQASAERIPGSVGGSTAKTRIYVGSLMWELTEEQVKAIFEPFGAIRSCQLIMNQETGKHRGYGFVEYVDEKSAADAIAAMDGFDLIGRKLKVNYASALVAPQSAYAHSAAHSAPPALPAGFTIPTLPASMLSPSNAAQTSLSAEDNLRIHSHEQRASIMQKLQDSGRQSPVLLLKNLVSAHEVDAELEGEVAEECGKYGRVREVRVAPDHTTDAVDRHTQTAGESPS